MKNKGYYWLLAFILIILLSQDYLFGSWDTKTSILGFPHWLFYFIGVHIIFIIAYGLFMKLYWKE